MCHTRFVYNQLLKVVQDHWVANHTRDWLISARGKEAGDSSSSKPIMSIDSNGVGHDFCISESVPQQSSVYAHIVGHSEFVAKKVKLWIEEILGGLAG